MSPRCQTEIFPILDLDGSAGTVTGERRSRRHRPPDSFTDVILEERLTRSSGTLRGLSSRLG
jgi:hypothetical protein